MKSLGSKTLALGLILAVPWACAAPGSTAEVMPLALKCPHGNTDPNCSNHVPEGGKNAAPPSREQEQHERAKQQAQQQDQQRAQQEAQKQEQQRLSLIHI